MAVSIKMTKPICEVSAPLQHKIQSYNLIKITCVHYVDFFEVPLCKVRGVNLSSTLILTPGVRQQGDKRS